MHWPVSSDRYLAYLIVMTAVSVTPGPAILFAISAGMTRGRRGALLAMLGMTFAGLIWFIGAALGLMIVAASARRIFDVAGALGVTYIAWLGIAALRRAGDRDGLPPAALRPVGGAVFRDAFVIQITNPKALFFYTAVLPPFVVIEQPLWPQMGAYAAATISLDALFMMVYGAAGAAFAEALQRPRYRRGFALGVGTLLLLTAFLMARRLLS